MKSFNYNWNSQEYILMKWWRRCNNKDARNKTDEHHHDLWVLSKIQIEVRGLPIPHDRCISVPASTRMLHNLLPQRPRGRQKEMWVKKCAFHRYLSCYSSQIGQSSQPACPLLRRADRQRDHVEGSWTWWCPKLSARRSRYQTFAPTVDRQCHIFTVRGRVQTVGLLKDIGAQRWGRIEARSDDRTWPWDRSGIQELRQHQQ